MLHQIQYHFPSPPTKEMIARARSMRRCKPLRWTRQGSATMEIAKSEQHRGTAGIIKCYGRANWTLLDIDERQPPSLWRYWHLAHLLGCRLVFVRMDRTRRGWHVILEWSRNFTRMEIVALQAIMGSDLGREMYNFVRARSGKKTRRWNLLFERKVLR